MPINQHLLARVMPFAFYILMMIITDLFNADIDPNWLYTLRLSGTALLIVYFWSSYTELVATKALSVVTLSIAILVGLFVFLFWINLNESWMVFGGGADDGGINSELSTVMIAMHLFGSSMIVPIMEELFWRSFIMRWIDQVAFLKLAPMSVTLKALCISSLLFASEHSLWFAGFLAGLIYAALYIRTQNLWYSIIAHTITNFSLGLWVIYTQQWQYW